MTYKLLGAAGATALAVAAVAGPAAAAGEETANVVYSCSSPAGDLHPSAAYAVDAPPTTMVAGQTVKLPTTGTITLDATTTGAAIALQGWDHFSGTITTTPTNSVVGQNLSIASTALGNSGGGTTTTAPFSGSTLLRSTTAGTYTLNLGNIGKAVLKGTKNGAPVSSITLPDGGAFGQCKNQATKTPLQNASHVTATVSVVKDASKTTVKASYLKAKRTTVAAATVKGATYKLAGTGKVKFTLKKGTHVLKRMSVTLNKKGIAKFTYKHLLKRGKYTVTAKFGGSGGLKASSGRTTFKVS